MLRHAFADAFAAARKARAVVAFIIDALYYAYFAIDYARATRRYFSLMSLLPLLCHAADYFDARYYILMSFAIRC